MWVSAGTLPPGLGLRWIGGISTVLEGTPVLAGTFDFTIAAADSEGCTGHRDYRMRVFGLCPAVAVVPRALPLAVAGMDYEDQLGALGGLAPYTFAIVDGAAPPGVTLSASGLLSGVPEEAGIYELTVRASAVGGCAGTTTYRLEVVSAR